MSLFPFEIDALARLLLIEARERKLTLTTAESCTGGLVAAALTAIEGSSDVFERGVVTYSNTAKEELLGVPGDMIADFGAVSEAVARAMAEGALTRSGASLAVAVTGIAGPGGGTPMKPVGTVHFAVARLGGLTSHRAGLFEGMDRNGVRLAATSLALELLRERLD
jgi:nicotinamide-nucleotide amidase